MKKLLLIPIFLFLLSCASSYNVRSMNDEFSDPNAPISVMLDKNAILGIRDPFGRSIMSELNCYLHRDKKTNDMINMGFYLFHIDSNQNLFIHNGDELIFIADGSRIVLKARMPRSDYKREINNMAIKGYIDYHYDSAWYSCAKEEFYKIAHARDLKMRVYGQNSVRDYRTDNSTISAKCVDNLKTFYDSNIK